jgi:adenosylhomocysteinase
VLDEGRSVFVVGDGVVVNLSAGEGHPVEIMDLTFAVQALAARYLLQHGAELAPKVHLLPYDIDAGIAVRKLETLGVEIDRLTDEQRTFRSSWEAFS